MPKNQKSPNKRVGIIILAIIISIVLYLAGVYSGLNANKIIKTKTENDLKAFENYINFLDTNLKTMQFEQTFMETLTNEQMCNFSKISFIS
jgi:hypothetical protein